MEFKYEQSRRPDIIDFINQFENEPSIDITFPITLIAADYTEIVIENEMSAHNQANCMAREYFGK